MWTQIRLQEQCDLGPHCLSRDFKRFQQTIIQTSFVVIGTLRIKIFCLQGSGKDKVTDSDTKTESGRERGRNREEKGYNWYFSFYPLLFLRILTTYEARHEISNNVVCATSKASDQPAHMRSLIRAFASPLNIL